MNNDAVNVTVTGAAGQIGYALLFRIASGQMLGLDQPVNLRLLEITPALGALDGVQMELDDCAFPLLGSITKTDDPNVAFEGSDYGLLVGAMPRKDGMERADLLEANGGIFGPQGKAIADNANPAIKVLVVGNPANTNALIAQSAAAGINPGQFTAMTRLDHNRAQSQVAQKLGVPVDSVKKMTIWGNHSATQYPDFCNAKINDSQANEVIGDEEWLKDTFIPVVQKRGAAIIEARGSSSAASAANAIIDNVKHLTGVTPDGDWNSVCVCSDGSYGIDEGLIASFPVRSDGALWEIVPDLDLNDFSKQKIADSVNELNEEREAVKDLLP